MANIDSALADTRAAADDLIATAERSEATWTTPRAPGKWSPSQIVEHVAIALEQSAKVASGLPSTFPNFPAPLRPLIRVLFFNRVVSKRVFPKSTAPKALEPSGGLSSPAQACARLERAFTDFSRACAAVAGSGHQVKSPVFGAVSAEDFARFQEVHIRHHCQQLRSA